MATGGKGAAERAEALPEAEGGEETGAEGGSEDEGARGTEGAEGVGPEPEVKIASHGSASFAATAGVPGETKLR